VRVVGRFLRAPRSRGRHMRNVVSLTLQLKDPHRNSGVTEVGLVEVKRHLIGDGRDLVFGFHVECRK
jgi:hypothetical protein